MIEVLLLSQPFPGTTRLGAIHICLHDTDLIILPELINFEVGNKRNSNNQLNQLAPTTIEGLI